MYAHGRGGAPKNDEEALKSALTLPAADAIDQTVNIQTNLALLLDGQGQTDEARKYSDAAMAAARESKDINVVAYATFLQGLLARHGEVSDAERLLMEILDGTERENAAVSMDSLQAKIAASTSCHAAIKVNMPLDQQKMEWLLAELAKTEAPMSCPHGRPIVLRYSVREIERAFKRI